MNKNIEIVNTAKAIYQYVVDVSRPPVTGNVSDTVSNYLEVGQPYFEIIKTVKQHNVCIGESFEYIIQVHNIGSISSAFLLIDQFTNGINVISINIDGIPYTKIDDLNTGIQLDPILPGNTVNVLIQVMILKSNSSCVCNKAYGLVMTGDHKYSRYESNEVCVNVVDKYCCSVDYKLCINCCDEIRDIFVIQQRMRSYGYSICRDQVMIEGYINIKIVYISCCGDVKTDHVNTNIKMGIPINSKISCENISDIQFYSLNAERWKFCGCQLFIDSLASVIIYSNI